MTRVKSRAQRTEVISTSSIRSGERPPKDCGRIRSAACFLVGGIAVWLSSCSADVSRYSEARAQALRDLAKPEYQEWYATEFRPVFNERFQSLLVKCVGAAPSAEIADLGFVMTVTRSGAVKQVIWKTTNELASCLELGLREAVFPPAPTEEIYYSLESRQRR